jgi:hypothetical protein
MYHTAGRHGHFIFICESHTCEHSFPSILQSVVVVQAPSILHPVIEASSILQSTVVVRTSSVHIAIHCISTSSFYIVFGCSSSGNAMFPRGDRTRCVILCVVQTKSLTENSTTEKGMFILTFLFIRRSQGHWYACTCRCVYIGTCCELGISAYIVVVPFAIIIDLWRTILIQLYLGVCVCMCLWWLLNWRVCGGGYLAQLCLGVCVCVCGGYLTDMRSTCLAMNQSKL